MRPIGAAFAVIELHNWRIPGASQPPRRGLIANNAMHAGVVLPAHEPRCNQPESLQRNTP
jgi:hypothetical protein